MTLKTFLRVTKQIGEINENVTRVELENSVSAGIRWGMVGPGMVPIFEEQSARLERGIRLSEWGNMELVEKAVIIAMRRIDNATKNHQAEAEIKAAKIAARKNSKG